MAKNKTENINKLITFTPKMDEMVAEIQEKKGYMSFSSVVHQGIIELHKTYFPAYIQAKDNSPVGKAKRKLDDENAKKQIETERKVGICEALDGTVVNENGTDYCKYHTFMNKKRYEQKVPVDHLTDDLPKSQYSPTKAKVLQLQKDGKVDYKV